MRFPPAVWGPIFWLTIHIVALGYSDTPSYAQKRAAKEFYEGLQHLIPCPTCREHYAEHLQQNPLAPSLDNRRDLFTWTVNVHNAVNKKLGKPTMTEDQALAFFSRLGARNRSPLWRPEDMNEVDIGSFAKGASVTAVGCAVVIGALWYLKN